MSDTYAPWTLAEAFQVTSQLHPDAIALRTLGGELEISWRKYAERVRTIAGGLAALGVGRGDAVALMMTNRPEFHFVDTAAYHLGAVPFSIYNTSSPEQIAFLLNSAKPRVVVCEEQFVSVLEKAAPGTSIEHMICVDGNPPNTSSLDRLASTQSADFDFDAAWQAVGPDDVLTVIYTSGTTGDPKGVQISHANMLAELSATNSIMHAKLGDSVVSFLPSAHIADRYGCHYLNAYVGVQVTTVADRTQLLPALVEVQPTLFGAVPQLWTKIRAGIEAMINAEPDADKRARVRAAITMGEQYVRNKQVGSVSDEQEQTYQLLDEKVFAPIRAKLGLARARFVQTGAAPVPEDLIVFFNAIGVPLVDVWGMSELSCFATMTPEGGLRVGTIGKALPGVDITAAEDGELLVRGPIVMKGYLGRPDVTAETIDSDGWLHTGDIGTIDADGYVRIIDRKKELIINAYGKNMSPANIEKAVKASSPLIGQVVAIGNNRQYNVALVVLDQDAAAQYAAARGITFDPTVLAQDEQVRAIVAGAVESGNTTLNRTEQIKKFRILPTFWEPGSDVLTHTLKLRRRPIDMRYAAEIEELYASTEQVRGRRSADLGR
ncbi:long-chain fatty acid--CoA ligase [Nocardia sp. NBC_00565]|uniref:AMP-dependent synthetase/ligase n=1 Tax=Nocardia sp. NBC_00565 TaxID=2975993 RepID=UPI002E80AF0F|nr:long-chain fatty acid--CoA ligase [Nocardia sp. NBC_00565]WUC05583.1 long-chain fatty acid--CoA ligase [Nocardia sp. NBC_00565]